MNVDLIAAARRVVGSGPNVTQSLQSTPREVPSLVRQAGIAAIVLGLLALGYGLFGGDADTQKRTLGIFLVCLVYFTGASQGAVMFAVAQTIALGRWGRPFKRIAEVMGTFTVVTFVLWILFLVGGGLSIYPWTHEELPPHKAIYLQPGFMIARQVVGLLILHLLSWVFIANSVRADMGVAAEVLGTRAPAWWGRFTAGWRGREAEVEAAYQKNIRIAPVLVVAYALVMSMFFVDAVMSLAPHWYANMFPAWLFVSSFWLGINWICIFSVFSRKWLKVDHLLTPKNYHDLGKLMFALSVFWTYTLFAQVLPIWYGNMPEETSYLLLRMYTEPWNGLAKVVGAMCFLIPFTVLLSRGIKKMPESLVGVAILIATGVFLERFLLVMPEVWHKDSIPLGLVEILVFAGFVGSFVTWVTTWLSKVPAVPFTDPFMNPNPADVHVHPEGEHGHAPAHH